MPYGKREIVVFFTKTGNIESIILQTADKILAGTEARVFSVQINVENVVARDVEKNLFSRGAGKFAFEIDVFVDRVRIVCPDLRCLHYLFHVLPLRIFV